MSSSGTNELLDNPTENVNILKIIGDLFFSLFLIYSSSKGHSIGEGHTILDNTVI